MRFRKHETYTFDFKLHVVELYLSTEISYQELALSVGLNNLPSAENIMNALNEAIKITRDVLWCGLL